MFNILLGMMVLSGNIEEYVNNYKEFAIQQKVKKEIEHKKQLEYEKQMQEIKERIKKEKLLEEEQKRAEELEKHRLLENMFSTTGFDFEGYNIVSYKGVVGGQVVLGTGFLSEFKASFADFLGNESDKFAEKLEKAKEAAMRRMTVNAMKRGGNAIIGIDFDYITFPNNMIGVVANGTAVVIEKKLRMYSD